MAGSFTFLVLEKSIKRKKVNHVLRKEKIGETFRIGLLANSEDLVEDNALEI